MAVLPLLAAERTVDPTFLHRYLPDVSEQKADMSTSTCHYKPLFGAGDAQAKVPRSVARFGEITVDPGGHCEAVAYPAEEQAIVILDGTGALDAAGQNLALRMHDFLYLPPGVRHAMASDSGVRLILMGFKIPGRPSRRAAHETWHVANLDDVKWQTASPVTRIQCSISF